MEEAWRDVIVRERAAGRRVDAFLARRFPSYSRSQIVRYIQEGKVRSLLRKLKPSTTLILGEVLRLYMPGLVPSGPPPAVPEILFEDEELLVVQKPPGMLVHPAGDQFVWALIGLVRAVRPKAMRAHCYAGGREDVVRERENVRAHAKAVTVDFRCRNYTYVVLSISVWLRRSIVAATAARSTS